MQILSIKLYFCCFITSQLLLFIFPDLAHGKKGGHFSLLKVPLKSSTHLLLNFWVMCFREDVQSEQSKC